MYNRDRLEETTINFLNNENQLFEMANIHPEESGIKPMLYSTFNGKNKFKHGPRVKVETINLGLVSILLPDITLDKKYNIKTIENEDKRLINEAIKYIKKNLNVFMNHWNGQIRDDELHDILRGKDTLEDVLKRKRK